MSLVSCVVKVRTWEVNDDARRAESHYPAPITIERVPQYHPHLTYNSAWSGLISIVRSKVEMPATTVIVSFSQLTAMLVYIEDIYTPLTGTRHITSR